MKTNNFEAVLRTLQNHLHSYGHSDSLTMASVILLSAMCMIKENRGVLGQFGSKEIYAEDVGRMMSVTLHALEKQSRYVVETIESAPEDLYEYLEDLEKYVENNNWLVVARDLLAALRNMNLKCQFWKYGDGVTKLFDSWLSASRNKKIAVLLGGTDWLEMNVAREKFLEIYNPSLITQTLLLMLAHLIDSNILINLNLELSEIGPVKPLQRKDFICDFPWNNQNNREEGSIEYLLTELCLKTYKGRGVIVTHPSETSNKKSRYLRRLLAESGYLQAVIHLPAKTKQFVNIEIVAFLIDTTRKISNVLFLDLRNGCFFNYGRHQSSPKNTAYGEMEDVFKGDTPYSKRISICEIQKNDWNLSTTTYVVNHEQRSIIEKVEASKISLNTLASLVRAQAIKHDKDSDVSAREVNVIDIDPCGMVSTPQKTVKIPVESDKKTTSITLRENDLVFAIKGSVCKVGLIPKHSSKWIAGQSFVVIRLKKTKTISAIYLLRYLKSKTVQAYLQRNVQGAHVPLLPMSHLKSLPVHMPTSEEIAHAEKNHELMISMYSRLLEIKKGLNTLSDCEF